jgi:hypothetical protein
MCYSLEKWRRFVKIKMSGVVEIYVNELIESGKREYENQSLEPGDFKPINLISLQLIFSQF